MRKVILLVSALMMVLMGCSSTADEGWPKEKKGKDYTVTRIDTPFTGAYGGGAMMDYVQTSEAFVVNVSSLIAKLEIISEPTEYKFEYLYLGTQSSMTLLAFRAKVLKVFYTDASVKEGDTITFLREEFSESAFNSEVIRNTSAETINLLNNKQYILFLDGVSRIQKQDDIETEEFGTSNFAQACKELANYFCTDPCRTIIICNPNSTYELERNFTTLTKNAESASVSGGMDMLQIQDALFEDKAQAMVNQYKAE